MTTTPADRLRLESEVARLKGEVNTLLQDKQKYQSLFELSGDALSILDLETGKFIECNEAAINMHGVKTAANFLELTPDQLSPEFQPCGGASKDLAMDRITKTFTEGPQVFEWVHARLDGSTFPCLVSLSAIPLESRKLILAIGRDISKLIDTQRHLQRAKQEAEAANQAKSDFLSNMSHELRTPLNAVIGFAQILKRRKDLYPEELEMINNIYQSGEHLLGLINDVLDISKIESGKVTIVQGVVDVRHMSKDIYQMFTPELGNSAVNLAITGAESVPRFLTTDPRKLKQILINLTSNALKFTNSGTVTLHFSYEGKTLKVQVKDTGSGINNEHLDLIFEPFSQSNAGLNASQGTGLGLSISRKFSQLLGGNLTVQSTPGQGSTFTLTVKATEVKNYSAPEETTYWKPISNSKEYTILIVDDNELNSRVLGKFLSEIGFTVITANSGSQAIEASSKFRPHLIFMDYKMPDLDGHQTAEKIKEKQPNVKIVMLTASILHGDTDQPSKTDADIILYKPYKESEVVEALKQLLNIQFDQTQRLTPKDEPLVQEKLGNCNNANQSTNSLLLVDDNEFNLMVASYELSDVGFRVDTAQSAEDALRKFTLNDYNLVVTDCEMPDIDGMELCRALLKKKPGTKVFGYTADKEKNTMHCLEAGMIAVMSKPFTEDDIRNLLLPQLTAGNG